MTAGPYGSLDSSEVDSSDTPAMKGYEACMAKVGRLSRYDTFTGAVFSSRHSRG